jgi:hypothetical protein
MRSSNPSPSASPATVPVKVHTIGVRSRPVALQVTVMSDEKVPNSVGAKRTVNWLLLPGGTQMPGVALVENGASMVTRSIVTSRAPTLLARSVLVVIDP